MAMYPTPTREKSSSIATDGSDTNSVMKPSLHLPIEDTPSESSPLRSLIGGKARKSSNSLWSDDARNKKTVAKADEDERLSITNRKVEESAAKTLIEDLHYRNIVTLPRDPDSLHQLGKLRASNCRQLYEYMRRSWLYMLHVSLTNLSVIFRAGRKVGKIGYVDKRHEGIKVKFNENISHLFTSSNHHILIDLRMIVVKGEETVELCFLRKNTINLRKVYDAAVSLNAPHMPTLTQPTSHVIAENNARGFFLNGKYQQCESADNKPLPTGFDFNVGHWMIQSDSHIIFDHVEYLSCFITSKKHTFYHVLKYITQLSKVYILKCLFMGLSDRDIEEAFTTGTISFMNLLTVVCILNLRHACRISLCVKHNNDYYGCNSETMDDFPTHVLYICEEDTNSTCTLHLIDDDTVNNLKINDHGDIIADAMTKIIG